MLPAFAVTDAYTALPFQRGFPEIFRLVLTGVRASYESTVNIVRAPLSLGATMSADALPELLDEIASVIGREGAEVFATHFGGQEVIIPINVDMETAKPFIAAIGADATRQLCEYFYTESDDDRPLSRRLAVPLGPAAIMSRSRKIAIDCLLAGATTKEAVQKSGLHERTVWRIRRKLVQGGRIGVLRSQSTRQRLAARRADQRAQREAEVRSVTEEMLLAGKSTAEVALISRYSVLTIRKIRRRLIAEGRLQDPRKPKPPTQKQIDLATEALLSGKPIWKASELSDLSNARVGEIRQQLIRERRLKKRVVGHTWRNWTLNG